MKTWKEYASELPESLSDETQELIRKTTASERHRARVHATIRAALAAVTVEENARCPGTQECVSAADLLAIDRNGIGGPAGCGNGYHDGGNGKTARMPAFAGLGSGRHHAGDGGAYAAAAKEAEDFLLAVAARLRSAAPREAPHWLADDSIFDRAVEDPLTVFGVLDWDRQVPPLDDASASQVRDRIDSLVLCTLTGPAIDFAAAYLRGRITKALHSHEDLIELDRCLSTLRREQQSEVQPCI